MFFGPRHYIIDSFMYCFRLTSILLCLHTEAELDGCCIGEIYLIVTQDLNYIKLKNPDLTI